MSESASEKIKGDIEKVENKPIKSVLTPEYCSWTDEDGRYVMEIYLPGVEKDSLKLKMNKENIFVSGETDSYRYVGAYGLCCPIDVDHIKSIYKNGLLKIEGPYLDPTFDTVDIKIE